MKNAPYTQLGYAILEQAVNDVQALQAIGLIRDGQVVEPWPRKRRKGDPKTERGLLVIGYDSPPDAKQLLHWFHNGGADTLLEFLESPIDAETICEKLEI